MRRRIVVWSPTFQTLPGHRDRFADGVAAVWTLFEGGRPSPKRDVRLAETEDDRVFHLASQWMESEYGLALNRTRLPRLAIVEIRDAEWSDKPEECHRAAAAIRAACDDGKRRHGQSAAACVIVMEDADA
jgi:hypothetical protein